MILEQITLGEDKESKRKAIQNNLGQHVILEDSKESWCHCRILKYGSDDHMYNIKVGDDRGKRKLSYQDLKQLIVIRSHPYYHRPGIR